MGVNILFAVINYSNHTEVMRLVGSTKFAVYLRIQFSAFLSVRVAFPSSIPVLMKFYNLDLRNMRKVTVYKIFKRACPGRTFSFKFISTALHCFWDCILWYLIQRVNIKGFRRVTHACIHILTRPKAGRAFICKEVE